MSNSKQAVAEDFPDGKSNLNLLWFACGKDDRLLEQSRQLSAALEEKNIPHTFKETAGSHAWPVWRRYLGEFMPLLFVKAK
jgi:enterochelin esterase family protein